MNRIHGEHSLKRVDLNDELTRNMIEDVNRAYDDPDPGVLQARRLRLAGHLGIYSLPAARIEHYRTPDNPEAA